MGNPSKALKEYSAFLKDDYDDDLESEITGGNIKYASGWKPLKIVDSAKPKPWLSLSLTSNSSDGEPKLQDITSEKVAETPEKLINEKCTPSKKSKNKRISKNTMKDKTKQSTEHIKSSCDLNSEIDFFKVICIDAKGDSLINFENAQSSSCSVNNNNHKGASQNICSNDLSSQKPTTSKRQMTNRRISTDFNDSFGINVDDFENDIVKSLGLEKRLENNVTSKKGAKNNICCESPNIFSTPSSESLTKPSPQFAQTNCSSQYSQFLKSSQFQKQLDEVISRQEAVTKRSDYTLNVLKENNKVKSSSHIEQKDKEHSSFANNKRKSLDNLHSNSKLQKTDESFQNVSNKENRHNCSEFETIPKNLRNSDIEFRMTQLFNSNQYRKGITQLFEKMEKSICHFGHNNDEKENSILQLNKNAADVDWNDDSFMANLSLDGLIEKTENGSINDVIKRALKENAVKAIQLQNLVNKTIVSTTIAVFKDLGPFYGLPEKVMELIKLYKGIDTLYDWQDECLQLPAVKQRKNLIYSLPTSGGKTLVAEILLLREIICRKRNVIFVLPYVAIVQEKVWALSPFAVALDFLIEEYAAGKGSYPPKKRRYKNSVYIATTEKAVGLINSLVEQARLDELGLVVVDELHLIGDTQRGGILEALLTKLIYLNEDIQIVGMSATIGNLSDIQQFLKADVYTRNFRPVELTEYVKCGNEIAKVNCNAGDDNIFEVVRKVDFCYSEAVAKMDPDRLGGLVMEVVPKGSCLIFCSTKNSCENVTRLLAKIVLPKLKNCKAKEKQQLMNALRSENGTLCTILESSLPFGIAYHHSGLTTDERKLIEEAYRSGIICVICCTSTLAAGVNLPAKRVIIRKPFIAKDFINLSRYKQMVGRAGRAGFGEVGESILICEKQDLPKVRNLFISPMDQTLSKMHEDHSKRLKHLFLSCISLKTANTKSQLENIANCTLLAVQQQKLNVDIKMLTKQAILKLFKYGAIQLLNNKGTKAISTPNSDVSVLNVSANSLSENSGSKLSNESNGKKTTVLLKNDDQLVVSKLGRAAIKGNLELSKAHLLYEDLRKAQESLVLLDCLHLLYLVTPYSVVEQTRLEKNNYHSILSRLGEKERKTAAILGITDFCIMRLYSNKNLKCIDERILNRFYLALMLYDLWNEVPIVEVSEKYRIDRGIVQNLMTIAATFAANVVSFCEELEEFWAFTYLLKGMSQRLAHCCCRELVPLMELPAVKQGRARQLYNAGFKTLQSVAKADPNELVQAIEFMTRRLANQLIAAAKLLLLEKVETLREEAEDVLDGVENPRLLLNYSLFAKVN